MEEYAYILDYLPQGVSGGQYGKREPLCYALGDEEFKLFELIPKAPVVVGQRVYIGKDTSKRAEIDHVKRRINLSELSRNANAELEYTIEQIAVEKAARFLRFYDLAGPLSLKKHALEELPGLGKMGVQSILDARKDGPFTSYANLTERTKVKTPEKLIAARILMEITDENLKRYLFVSKK